MNVKDEFVSPPSGKYHVKIGKHTASSLSGFIAGAIVASIIWMAVAYFVRILS